jgi:predicted Zn-dependent protease
MAVDRLVNIKRLEESFSPNPSRPSINNFMRLKLWCRLETELSDRLLAELLPSYSNNPHDIDTIYSLALIYEKLGSSEEAEKYYKQGLALEPKDVDLLRDYAIFLYRRNQIKNAEAKLRIAWELNPDDPLANHYLGRVLMDQKHPKEAIKAFLKSRKICPEFPDNHHFLGILYSQQGDEKKSHKSFERYFSIIGNQEAAQLHSQKKKQLESVTKDKKFSSK